MRSVGTGSNAVLRQRTTKVISEKVCSRQDWWDMSSNEYTLCVGEQGTGYQITCYVSSYPDGVRHSES